MPDSSDSYDLDLYAPELLSNPYRTYARLRANRGVHYRSTEGNTVQTVLVDLNSGEVVKILPADTEPEGSGEQNGQESGD